MGYAVVIKVRFTILDLNRTSYIVNRTRWLSIEKNAIVAGGLIH